MRLSTWTVLVLCLALVSASETSYFLSKYNVTAFVTSDSCSVEILEAFAMNHLTNDPKTLVRRVSLINDGSFNEVEFISLTSGNETTSVAPAISYVQRVWTATWIIQPLNMEETYYLRYRLVDVIRSFGARNMLDWVSLARLPQPTYDGRITINFPWTSVRVRNSDLPVRLNEDDGTSNFTITADTVPAEGVRIEMYYPRNLACQLNSDGITIVVVAAVLVSILIPMAVIIATDAVRLPRCCPCQKSSPRRPASPPANGAAATPAPRRQCCGGLASSVLGLGMAARGTVAAEWGAGVGGVSAQAWGEPYEAPESEPEPDEPVLATGTTGERGAWESNESSLDLDAFPSTATGV